MKTNEDRVITKTGTKLAVAFMLCLGLWAANALGFEDYVSNGNNGGGETIYNVPSGTTIDWAAQAGSNGQAGVWITGGGINVYDDVYNGNSTSNAAQTTFTDDIGYQIWAYGDGYNYALIAAYW